MFKRTLIALIVFLMTIQFASASEAVRQIEGIDMPEIMQVEGQSLALNGVGVRKVMFMQPYVAGLYLTAAETNPANIMNADEPMLLRLAITRDTGRRMFLRALRNGMRSATGTLADVSWEAIEGRYEQFVEMFHEDSEDGDIIEFAYLPEEGLHVVKNGERQGTLSGLDFKQAFFGIWFNDDSPADSDLKKGLIAGDVRVAIADIRKDEAVKVAMVDAEADAERAAAEKAEAEAEAAAMRLAEKKAEEEMARKKEADKAIEVAASTEKPAPAQVSGEPFDSRSVYFGFDDSNLSDAAKNALNGKVKWLKANPNVTLILEASTDELGPAEYNQVLAGRRGASVKNYLEQAGISSNRITVKVVGEIAGYNYRENRRVGFRVK